MHIISRHGLVVPLTQACGSRAAMSSESGLKDKQGFFGSREFVRSQMSSIFGALLMPTLILAGAGKTYLA